MSTEITITTSDNRVFVYRGLKPSEQVKIMKLLKDNSMNQGVLAMSNAAASIRSIDGKPVPFPLLEVQLDALYDQIDENGFKAIFEHLQATGEAEQADLIASAKN
jgi:hypothetical protein